MRIDRIKLDKYGPLNNLDLKLMPGINVIYGSNESGKSLTMEFLLKKLAKKKIAKDRRIDRVQEEPEGFIVFYDKEEIKLEQNQYLTDLLPLVKDEDICKIFVMRDSDLNIPDDEYYETITDRLTGLRTSDISRISEALINFGCLKPKDREISNLKKFGQLKDKLNKAKDLKKEIFEYIEAAKRNSIHIIEGEIFDAYMKLKRIECDLEKQKKARLRDEYFLNEKAIETIEISEREIKNLPSKDNLEKVKGVFEKYKEDKAIIADFIKISSYSKWNIFPSFLFCLLFWIVWFTTTQPMIGIITPIITAFFLFTNIVFWFIAFSKRRKLKIKTEE